MRCESCILETPEGEALSPEAFAQRLAACDACPLLLREDASPALLRLARRHREAAGALRRTASSLRQREIELDALRAEAARYEEKIANLERLHKVSTQELEAQLLLVQRQQEAIRMLSTPMIEIDDGVLTLPVVGTIDAERMALVTEALLQEVQASGVSHVILDLTGLAEVDVDTAMLLARIFAAVQLLGAQVLITGMRGNVAKQLVAQGAELHGIVTLRNVKHALQRCQARGSASPHGARRVERADPKH